MTSSPRVLLTGINGYVGQHMAHYLLARDIQVIGIGRQDNCSIEHDLLTYKRCNIADFMDVHHLLNSIKVNYILHLAGDNDVRLSFNNPVPVVYNNTLGTFHLLECARSILAKNLKGFLTIGTAYEYAMSDSKLTEDCTLAPSSPYGWSKLWMTMIANMYGQLYTIPTVVARTFNLIGPGNASGVCAQLAQQVVKMEQGLIPPTLILGDQTVKRDFLDVRDAVAAYWSLLQLPKQLGTSIYNVCSGISVSISLLVQLFQRFSHVPFEINVNDGLLRQGESNVIQGDNTKLLTNTGWKPTIPIEQSIRDILAYYRTLIIKT